jgi:hypothetical protein
MFVWSVRQGGGPGPQPGISLSDSLSDSLSHGPAGALPECFQPPMPPPCLLRADSSYENAYAAAASGGTGGEGGEDPQDIQSQLLCFNEYYLTSVGGGQGGQGQGQGQDRGSEQKSLKFGRPNLMNLFTAASNLCKEHGIRRVGVCVCGPAALRADVRALCAVSRLQPGARTVRFDCHSEGFDL